MEDAGDFVTDYHLSIEPMAALGWQVETVPVAQTLSDWDEYDAVYICTPWDYPEHLDRISRGARKRLIHPRALC